MQVRRNTGSTARQYDLRQRAVELGWSVEQIVIIDQDQGRSGASSANREGFQFLVAEVGLGHAGAVFSLEASRLARASSDWYRLIEICALTKTLVVDEEQDYLAWPRPTAHLASPQERQRILALAQDLPRLWQAETTTHADRKQLLRFLIKDVTLTRRETTFHIGIRWQTEALIELEIARPSQRTAPAVIERIRQLAPSHTDHQIAEILNQEGLTTGKKLPFIPNRVQWVRHKHGIALGPSKRPDAYPNGQREDGRYTARATAELLNVVQAGMQDGGVFFRIHCCP